LTFLRGGPLANAAQNSNPRVGLLELKIASVTLSEALKAYLQGQKKHLKKKLINFFFIPIAVPAPITIKFGDFELIFSRKKK
jgi:hypothetical protein